MPAEVRLRAGELLSKVQTQTQKQVQKQGNRRRGQKRNSRGWHSWGSLPARIPSVRRWQRPAPPLVCAVAIN